MVPKELLEIRFLQLFPDFVDLFIDARIGEADDNLKKSEEYRCKANDRNIFARRLIDSICEQQKKMFLEYESLVNGLHVQKIRSCYLTGLADGLKCAKEAGR